MRSIGSTCAALLLVLAMHCARTSSFGQTLYEPQRCIYPEQRQLDYRQPSQICRLPPPTAMAPRTVEHATQCLGQTFYLSLDEAISVALSNAEVIRVLAGNTAISSGRTVYDPAIQNVQVDVARALFDPQLSTMTTYNHVETMLPLPDAGSPSGVFIDKVESENLNVGVNLSQTKASGTTYQAGVTTAPTNSNAAGLLLDPNNPTALNFGLSKPLLQGGNTTANLAPIVIARIDTERTFYQLKDSIQEMVRGVMEGYWSIVAARVDVWARRQQVEQLEFAYNFFDAQRRVGRGNVGDTAQAQVSLANFRANLIAAEAELLNREAAFRNLLGLEPVDELCLIPTTPPVTQQQSFDWNQLLAVAEQFRPDIVQLKLQIEADQQRLRIADNNALPRVDAIANQRVSGIGGTGPTGITTSRFSAYDLQVGLDVRLPLGLRSERALVRQSELVLARDRALLRQQLHQVTHSVAQSIRNLEQFYRQYEAFRTVREAAKLNLDRQFNLFRVGGVATERITYLQVLQAVTDWGNAVSSEASSLMQYNIELANLQREIGTIIEDHGIRFYEEYYASTGALLTCQNYPEALWASGNQPQYPIGDEPTEDSFDLQPPVPKAGRSQAPLERLPQPPQPRQLDPLDLFQRDSSDTPAQLPPQAQPDAQAPDQKVPEQRPVRPPSERLPGDDIREFLDRVKRAVNPFDRPESIDRNSPGDDS